MSDLPQVIRGEIWDIVWEPARGSEQKGIRPSLIIQTDAINRSKSYPNTIVVALTTKPRAVPTHIQIDPTSENGLTQVSWAKCEQILTISKERLAQKHPRGHVTLEIMEQIESAIRIVLAL